MEGNLDIKIDKGVLNITGKLTDGRPSKSSGKTLVVASSGGYVDVGEYKVSLNVIKKR